MRMLFFFFVIALSSCGTGSVEVQCKDTLIKAKLKDGADGAYVKAAITLACQQLEK